MRVRIRVSVCGAEMETGRVDRRWLPVGLGYRSAGDKSNLNSYYSVTQQLLSNLEQLGLYHFNDCHAGCKNVDHISHIDLAFNSVVSVLFTASTVSYTHLTLPTIYSV